MRIIQRIISIVALVTLFYACTKQEETQSYPQMRVPIAATIQNLIFEEGSYWVYKRQTDNLIDSVGVKGAESKWLYMSGGTILQEVLISYYSTQFDFFSEYAAYHIITEGKMSGGIKYIGGKVGDSLYNAYLIEIHDTLIVDGVVYTNVTEMAVGKDEYIENDMNLFYADSVGVIRKEIKDSTLIVETWDLIKHNVTIYDLE